MDDTDIYELSGANEIFDSTYYEEKIAREFNQKKKVAAFKYSLDTTSITVPEIRKPALPERKLNFTDITHPDKALLYRLIVAAYNHSFTNEFATLTAKQIVNRESHTFVEWLNEVEITNRYSLFKEYETFMFDLRRNHGGYSALKGLYRLIHQAFQDHEFSKSLTTEETKFLSQLRNTKISPNLNKKQISLASYFGALDWLRCDDIGIGNQLYQSIASAKLTINSLKCTASTIIIEIGKAKSALRQLILESSLTASDFELPDFQGQSSYKKKVVIGHSIYKLLCRYHDLNNTSPQLRNALELVLLSNVSNLTNFEKVLPALDSKQNLATIFHSINGQNKDQFSGSFADGTFCAKPKGNLLSFETLRQIADESKPVPITKLEALMFSWLMASLTVQPWDIPKLSRDSFRLLKVGTRITHIECEYFKGRANAIHNTRTLSTRKIEGKALLVYLNQHSKKEFLNAETCQPRLSGFVSKSGTLNSVLGLPFMLDELAAAHKQNDRIPLIIPSALKKLISHGQHTENIVSKRGKTPYEERRALVSQSKTPCAQDLFGLLAIKNSAVHAHSDPYTLHYLINRNSHTNQTEKLNYLTPDNEEFMNAAGRITRSIMYDLIDNVFDLNFTGLSDTQANKEKAAFNNEFGTVTNTISYKSGEMLSRLRVVTEQDKGTINEVGVLSLSERQEDAFSPIYVLDSEVTAFKMFNYLHEFKHNYKKLLNRNPDYLYQTVFPTVEWIERVLGKLSKTSLKRGDKLLERMLKSGISISVFHSI